MCLKQNILLNVKGSPALEVAEVVVANNQADLAGALHEVSNTLTVVLGWLEAARAQEPDDDKLREAIEVAHAHAVLGHRVARAAIGAEVAEVVKRSAGSVAEDAVRGVLQEARRAAVRVTLVAGSASEELVSDASRALQILVNLLLNAIAFSPQGGTVTVTLAREGRYVSYLVSDEGPGVAPDRADGILSSPNSTRRGGAGIGLSHSALLAAEKGGELALTRPGPGAAFRLRWPVCDEPSGAHHTEPVKLQGVRVLVIEDDINVLKLVELALEACGAQVLSATNPEELTDLLANGQTFDAALVDLSPFDDDEDPALRLLRAAVNGRALILISGLARDVPPVLDSRVACWVRKPFEMGEVVTVLSHLTARRPPMARASTA